MKHLEDYRDIVGDEIISEIFRKSKGLYGKKILHVNSSYQGGGVAEILNHLVPLMSDLGIEVDWRVIHGHHDFFNITKKFHNSLQGEEINFSRLKRSVYTETNEQFTTYANIDHDAVIIHDPQPLPLIRYFKKRQPWIWRAHIDLSEPYADVWDYLKQFIIRYDKAIFSAKEFVSSDIGTETDIIYPSIDPLTVKNKEIDQATIDKYLNKYGIKADKPIISQISRFDKWKDPEGVIEVFDRVNEEIDCRLVLLGAMATDDPEGPKVYESVVEKSKGRDDIIVINKESDILVNVLQRVSSVVLQKSLKEGFGLTVTEALWKSTPVVASDVGGIPLQVTDGETGFLVDPEDYEEVTDRILEILEDPELGAKLGGSAHRNVKEHFLITRHLLNWLEVLKKTI
ncbi:MAG: glycosyltransferase [Candidatus Bipolaricaulota bacterium]|nr:glycosyltransferase [Candidatus Bipolaricaulota bacterium]